MFHKHQYFEPQKLLCVTLSGRICPISPRFTKLQSMDPFPLLGWRYIHIDGQRLLESPAGQRCATKAEAFDLDFNKIASGRSDEDSRVQLTFPQKFFNECCSTNDHVEEEDGEGT